MSGPRARPRQCAPAVRESYCRGDGFGSAPATHRCDEFQRSAFRPIQGQMGLLSKVNVGALLLLVTVVSATAHAEDVVDEDVGYALAVPEGWDRIPDGPLSRAALMRGSAADGRPSFVAG